MENSSPNGYPAHDADRLPKSLRGICFEGMTCAMCLDLVASPSTLPCGHTFCLECLKTALALAAATRLQQCPTCRAKLPRPMPPLSVNTMIKAMLELLLTDECRERESQRTSPEARRILQQHVVCRNATGSRVHSGAQLADQAERFASDGPNTLDSLAALPSPSTTSGASMRPTAVRPPTANTSTRGNATMLGSNLSASTEWSRTRRSDRQNSHIRQELQSTGNAGAVLQQRMPRLRFAAIRTQAFYGQRTLLDRQVSAADPGLGNRDNGGAPEPVLAAGQGSQPETAAGDPAVPPPDRPAQVPLPAIASPERTASEQAEPAAVDAALSQALPGSPGPASPAAPDGGGDTPGEIRSRGELAGEDGTPARNARRPTSRRVRNDAGQDVGRTPSAADVRDTAAAGDRGSSVRSGRRQGGNRIMPQDGSGRRF